ncbi:MAG: hypothetical protein A2V63_08735 [Candidatus Eisenbacteria bacterium RBG_19FT_COMBO_70_11]|nr:MAG: hypothetical protein A2V63_08735 [Candidatus Eisenbacteria bacterium RBG_19FT_COMBO_70_11]
MRKAASLSRRPRMRSIHARGPKSNSSSPGISASRASSGRKTSSRPAFSNWSQSRRMCPGQRPAIQRAVGSKKRNRISVPAMPLSASASRCRSTSARRSKAPSMRSTSASTRASSG